MVLDFDESYFNGGDGYSAYKNYPHFKDRALWVQNNLSGTILEVGCAAGFLIYELDLLGIEIFGIDISSYIISQAPSSIKDRISLLDIIDLTLNSPVFDWIISWNVLDCLDSDNYARFVAQALNASAKNQLHIIQTDGDEDYIKQGYFIRDYHYWRNLLPFASIVEEMGIVHSSFGFSKIPLSYGSETE